MQFGLVVVSASRSRPYPGPQGAAPRDRPCGLPLGETRSWRRGRRNSYHRRRLSPRHGTVTRMGRDPPFCGARVRGAKFAIIVRAAARGVGPGRGPFGRGAPQLSAGCSLRTKADAAYFCF